MTGFFGRVFGKKKTFTEQIQDEILSVYDPSKEADRIGLALLVNLQKQLGLLGYEIGQVPPEGEFVSDKCRGYLYGLSLGILVSEGIELSRDAVIDTVIAAFALTYGDESGRDLSFQTAQDVSSGKPDVVWASDWGLEDVKGVYASGGITSTAGFYLAANGMI
jgi:hypothetical protein